MPDPATPYSQPAVLLTWQRRAQRLPRAGLGPAAAALPPAHNTVHLTRSALVLNPRVPPQPIYKSNHRQVELSISFLFQLLLPRLRQTSLGLHGPREEALRIGRRSEGATARPLLPSCPMNPGPLTCVSSQSDHPLLTYASQAQQVPLSESCCGCCSLAS